MKDLNAIKHNFSSLKSNNLSNQDLGLVMLSRSHEIKDRLKTTSQYEMSKRSFTNFLIGEIDLKNQ